LAKTACGGPSFFFWLTMAFCGARFSALTACGGAGFSATTACVGAGFSLTMACCGARFSAMTRDTLKFHH
jgi:hypothetical protein